MSGADAAGTAGDLADPGDREWPEEPTLERLAEAAARCRACELHEGTCHTVFGQGPAGASLMFIGEQPGDSEDRRGEPFVGPSGRLLDTALADLKIPRDQAYVTNAVKHFRHEVRGKRRLHKNPNLGHVRACAPWLRAELALVDPDVLVALGATAGKALLGSGFRITQHRGEVLSGPGGLPPIVATAHPASLVRIPDHDERQRAYDLFLRDIALAADVAASAR